MRVLITGDAGFIGFHLAKHLLQRGDAVLGIDGLTAYYDPRLKAARLAQLKTYEQFSHITGMLEDSAAFRERVLAFKPDAMLHLAAQAGVRYSIEAPDAYISANVEGTLRLLELAREAQPRHLLVASTSSVYGGNTSIPFREVDATAAPVSLYAATKIATEALSHSFAHLYGVPTTCFRFFTVYGPWGRPDMALYKFVTAIRASRPIDIYGQGKMSREFTYIDDLVYAVSALIETPPVTGVKVSAIDSLSPIAPFRTVNIAGGASTQLLDFIREIEKSTGAVAEKRMLPMQAGDVVATQADSTLLRELIGEYPQTPLATGVYQFVSWFDHYNRANNAGGRQSID